MLQTQPLLIKKCQNHFKCLIGKGVVWLFVSFVSINTSHAQTWVQLPDSQKEILAPLESDWSSITKDQKKKWVEVANRYPQMVDTEKSILQSRMSEWANLSPEQRRAARDNYLRSLKFSPEKKAEAWHAYQQLSDEDKKRLAEKKVSTTKPTAVTSPTLK
jgi:hypothetical protein